MTILQNLGLALAFAVTAAAQSATTVAVNSSVAIPRLGQTVVLTAVVSPPATGTVEFLDDFNILGTAVLNGSSQASLAIRFAVPRTFNIRAVYAGNATHARSISPVLNVSVRPLTALTFSGSLVLPESYNRAYLWHDVNGDGIQDVIAQYSRGATNGSTVNIGNGSGGFTQVADLPGYRINALADFDSDGKVDALAFPNEGAVKFLKGNGSGSFSPTADLPNGPTSTLDYNRDGKADYLRYGALFLLNSPPAYIGLGRGDGTFDPAEVGPSFGTGFVVDLNSDDFADRAYTYSTQATKFDPRISVYKTSLSWTIEKSTLPSQPTLVEDLNGDGRDDILFAGSDSGRGPFTVSLTNADGSSRAPVAIGASTLFVRQILDWNGDGLLDLVGLEAVNNDAMAPFNLIVYPGAGDGTFGAKIVGMFNVPSTLLDVRDVNNDGYIDLIVGGGDNPTVLLGSGNAVGMTLVQPSISQYNSGTEYTFVASFQTPAGAADLSKLYLRISPAGDANACLVEVTPGSGAATVRLADNSGTVFSSTTLGNAQCSVRAGGTQLTAVGNTMTVSVPITFQRGFVTPVNVALRAISAVHGDTGYITVRSIAAPSTTPVNVTPDSGAGAAATFTAKFAAYPPAQLSLAYFLVGDAGPTSLCQVEYNAITNKFRLLKDGAWLETAPGTAVLAGNL
jgi:hypothetical protein